MSSGSVDLGQNISLGDNSLSFLARSVGISATTLLVPSGSGMYEIKFYGVVQTAATSGSLTVNLEWTDPNKLQSKAFTLVLDLGTVGSWGSNSLVIEATQATHILIQASLVSLVGLGLNYDLYAYAKRIN